MKTSTDGLNVKKPLGNSEMTMADRFMKMKERLIRFYFDHRHWNSLKDESHCDDVREAHILYGKVLQLALKSAGSALQIPDANASDFNWATRRQKRRTEIISYYSHIIMDTSSEHRCLIYTKKSSLKYSLNEIRLALLSDAKFVNVSNKREVDALTTLFLMTTFTLSDNGFNKKKARILAMENLLSQSAHIISNDNIQVFINSDHSDSVDVNELVLNFEAIRKITSSLSDETISQKLRKNENPFA